MGRINRNRQKRTIYLGPREEEALEGIQQRMGFRTKATAMRFAVMELVRRMDDPGAISIALERLLVAVEGLEMLAPADHRRLGRLCREARAQLCRPAR